MSRSKKRRIARSRRRRVRRYRARTYAALYEWRLTMPDYYYTAQQDAIISLLRPRLDRLACCKGCLYTNKSHSYCGLGMSPVHQGCDHRELLMEESYD